MKLKLNEAGFAVVQDGKPVYVHDDGKEIPFDAMAAVSQINSRAQQSQRVETENKQLKDQLQAFAGIEDPQAALKALTTVKNLDQKKLVDAGEVEKVKAEAIKAVEERFAPVVKENGELKNQLFSEKIGGAFSRSKFIAEKIAIPPDMMQARFGDRFKIEEGKVVAYDQSGNKIFSRAKPGDFADVEEALEIIVDQYPYKENILKGTGNSGTGGRPAGNGAGGAGGPPNAPRTKAEAYGAAKDTIGRSQARAAFLNSLTAVGKSPAEAQAAWLSLPDK